MSRVRYCLFGLLAYSSLIQAQAISPRDFAYGQLAIPARDAAAYRFALPLSVYQNTVREDLGDLRVFNAEGVTVPFSLSRPAAQSLIHKTPIAVTMFPLHEGARILIDDHFARTRLLALENTIGGKVLLAGYVAEAVQLAREHKLATHLDGARVFNAAVASGKPLTALCAPFDSVSICFSKGLGTPLGSVLVGSKALLESAHRWRKVLGGGMRQAGILAAACLYALDHNVERLAEDHANAAHLAAGLAQIDQVKVQSQATNMVFVQFPKQHCAPLEAWLKERGILTQMLYASRFVTHMDVSRADIDTFLAAVKGYFAAH